MPDDKPDVKAKNPVLVEAGKLGAQRRWHPDQVKDAVDKGSPIPTAPVRPPPSIEAGGQAEAQRTKPVPVGGAAAPAVGTPSPEPAPVHLTNETPVPPKGPAPMSWYSQSTPVTPKPEETGADLTLGSDMLTDTVVMVHGWAADESGYEGWRLTPDEAELWRKVIRFLLRYLPMKEWGLIGTLVALSVMEGKKFIGWNRWRKRTKGPTRPLKAPPMEAEPSPASEPEVPHGAYGRPTLRANA